MTLFHKYQRQVVVLVDEYEKPILDVIEDIALARKNRDILKKFYGVMQGTDQYLRFVFLTGVARFSEIGIFSDFHNLKDISMVKEYATICGITQEELEHYFNDHIDSLAEKENITKDECLSKIKKWYNGFYFCEDSISVYNPFSTLLLLDSLQFSNYWFSSGTPTFLIKLIKKASNIDLDNIDHKKLSLSSFNSFEVDNLNLIAVLYQTGYLTIKNYDQRTMFYILGYANYEVEISFKEIILQIYYKAKENKTNMSVY